MKDKMMSMECCEGHKRKKGLMMLLVGIILMANAYLNFLSWWMLIGVLVALGGLLKLIIPMKPCCQ